MLGAELPPIQPNETILLGSDGRAYGRDIKQSEQSKVSENTRDVLIYIQGNTATTKEQLEAALTEVQNNIETFIQK